jgi:hypothetical protein
MGACITAHYLKLRVKKVISVAPIGHAIVNYQLAKDFGRCVTVERQVFTVTVDDLAHLLKAVLHGLPIGALMREETLGACVVNVLFRDLGDLVRPP